MSEQTDVGPLIDGEACERVAALVREARQAGAVVQTGGEPIGRSLFAPIPSEAQSGITKVDITHVAGERLLPGEAVPVEGPRILAAGKSAATPILVKDAK